MECYTDFMRNFRDAFLDDMGTSITEIVLGCGPCGELRYPAYVEANGWRFPGVGCFSCLGCNLWRACCTQLPSTVTQPCLPDILQPLLWRDLVHPVLPPRLLHF